MQNRGVAGFRRQNKFAVPETRLWLPASGYLCLFLFAIWRLA